MFRKVLLIPQIAPVVLLILLGCSSNESRKIKLADVSNNETSNVRTASSVLQIDPEDQRSIAILFFDNQTGDANLDWLRRGISEMLVTDLTQSPYLNVFNTQKIQELLVQSGEEVPENIDLTLAAKVARNAKIETLLTGRIYNESGELVIEVELRDAETNKLIRKEVTRSPGMEQIFSMVNELSQKVRTNLRGDLIAQADPEYDLSDMTNSIEAFRCYTEAIENQEKFLYKDAEKCLLLAIKADTSFAAAYLRLAQINFSQRKTDEGIQALKKARQFADKLSKTDKLHLELYEYEFDGDIENLMKTMEKFVAHAPQDVDARMQLATMYKYISSKKALKEFKKILDIDPARKLAYNEIAYLYADRGDLVTALKFLDKYEELAVNEPNPHDSRGEILMRAGQLSEGVPHLKKALEIRPDFVSSAENLTLIFSELGNLDEALIYSNESIKHARSDLTKANSYANQARILWRSGKIKKAEKAIEKAFDTWPKSIYPIIIAGEMYQSIGDTMTARKIYQSFFTKNKSAVTNREWNLQDIAQYLTLSMEIDLPQKEVVTVLEDLIESEPSPFLRDQFKRVLATAYLRMGETQKATETIAEIDTKFLTYLTKFKNRGWNSGGWKYMSEWIDLAPVTDSTDYSDCGYLYDIAKEAGRKDLEVMARYIYAQYLGKFGRKDELAKEYKALGTPLEENWSVIGPYPNDSGFNTVFPPEEKIGQKESYPDSEDELKWRPAVDGSYDGYINLKKIFGKSSWSVAYAALSIHSPDKRVVQIRLGTDEAGKLWFNNELVWQAYRLHDEALDHDIVKVVLWPGDNNLLLKVTNSIQEWGFYLRITDKYGDGFSDIQLHPPGEESEQDIALEHFGK